MKNKDLLKRINNIKSDAVKEMFIDSYKVAVGTGT